MYVCMYIYALCIHVREYACMCICTYIRDVCTSKSPHPRTQNNCTFYLFKNQKSIQTWGNSRCQTHACMLQSGRTQPPNLLTEAELIETMDRHGVGTDATIVSSPTPVHVIVYILLACSPCLLILHNLLSWISLFAQLHDFIRPWRGRWVKTTPVMFCTLVGCCKCNTWSWWCTWF